MCLKLNGAWFLLEALIQQRASVFKGHLSAPPPHTHTVQTIQKQASLGHKVGISSFQSGDIPHFCLRRVGLSANISPYLSQSSWPRVGLPKVLGSVLGFILVPGIMEK